MMWILVALAGIIAPVTILFSDRGTPRVPAHWTLQQSYLQPDQRKEELFLREMHFKTKQGIKNFNAEQRRELRGRIRILAARSVQPRLQGRLPEGRVSVQIMRGRKAETTHQPFDLTKFGRWRLSLQEVGELVLDRNPENYFAEVEQAAFEPRNIVPGWVFHGQDATGRLISSPDPIAIAWA